MDGELVNKAYEAARDALSEYSQQDDYLLAHGASLLSEESHEIFHIDALRRAVIAAVNAALTAQQQDRSSVREGVKELLERAANRIDTCEEIISQTSGYAPDTELQTLLRASAEKMPQEVKND